MSEEVIKDMVEKLVSRVYELDLDVLRSLVDIKLYSACDISKEDMWMALYFKDWKYVKDAYVKCAVAMIIYEVYSAKLHEKPVTDDQKEKFIRWFVTVIPPIEYEGIAKETLSKLEESIVIAQYGIIKKKYG
jgi:hypothetical protein